MKKLKFSVYLSLPGALDSEFTQPLTDRNTGRRRSKVSVGVDRGWCVRLKTLLHL
jgi:hypothetical protein